MGTARTILVVEDNALLVQLVRQMLETDYTVVEASNGEEGVALATEAMPHLIVMDLMMPVMDGWQAIEKIRSAWKTCRIPIIALTAVTDLRGTRRATKLGADAVLEKPIEEPELIAAIERLIGTPRES